MHGGGSSAAGHRSKRVVDNQLSLSGNDFFTDFTWERHWLHVALATAVGTVVLSALLVYVIVKRRRKAGTPLTPNAPKIHCPAVAIDINTSRQQPDLPINVEPVRVKARGLLERRGSSASLTIDLTHGEQNLPYGGSPPKECSAEEYLISAGNRMTRRQMRTCMKNVRILHQEFLEIPFNHPCKPGMPGCGVKNRYKTIWPNEWTMVKLDPEHLDTPGWSLSDPSVTYINANYIRGYDGAPRSFVATQGPLPNTVNDFWAMVWQERASCIVMMTKLKEKNKVKCEQYLPQRDGQYGLIHVQVKMTVPRNGFYVRDLILQKGDETQHLRHFWFTGWPDHKAPTSTANQLLDLVRTVESYRTVHRDKCSPARSGPVVVHCSAGIGRTGCFIATCIGTQQLREEAMVDVLGIVCQMRLDRGGMIQTPEQYEFIHHALALYERQLPESPTTAPLKSRKDSTAIDNFREGS